MRSFIYGLLTMASAVSALFFLRYWTRTRDRLFGFFSLAFAVMAVEWANHLGIQRELEATEYRVYVLRFIAFMIIMVGIIDKNRRGNRP
jgi:hypothetical protein